MSILALFFSTSTRGNITQSYHVEFPLVFSRLVLIRDVGGHGRAADVVHDVLLKRHHLVVVDLVGLLFTTVPSCSVYSFSTKQSLVLTSFCFLQHLGEQPDLVVLVCFSMLVVSFLGQTMVAWGDYCLSYSVLSLRQELTWHYFVFHWRGSV